MYLLFSSAVSTNQTHCSRTNDNDDNMNAGRQLFWCLPGCFAFSFLMNDVAILLSKNMTGKM